MKIEYLPNGIKYIFEEFQVFFGNKHSCNLARTDNSNSMIFLNQIHGDRIVPAARKSSPVQADGHWTQALNTKLAIKTADCMPVFAFDCENKVIWALHIGWRGLASQIFRRIKNIGGKTQFLIGPHIGSENFYLSSKNLEILLNSKKWRTDNSDSVKRSTVRPKQWSVNLAGILEKELRAHKVKTIIFSEQKTFWSQNHFSHRRLPFNQHRHVSYIEKF